MDLSDHPTAPGRERVRPRLDVPLSTPAEPGRQMSRPRLPLPPVPAGSRPAAGSRPVAVAAPPTSAAPFQAVPTPEPRVELPAAVLPAAVPPVDVPASAPARSGRTPAPLAPRVPRQTTPAGTPSSSYGDWTKPSRSDDTGRSRLGPDTGPHAARVVVAPATTAIPERGRAAEEPFDELDTEFGHAEAAVAGDAPEPVDGPGTGPVVRGRAAYRVERQAADAARRKAAKRNGTPDVLFDDEPAKKPHRVLKGLAAMAVVAAAVLGVYTVTQPEQTEPVGQTQTAPGATPTVAPAVAPPTTSLPPLEIAPLEAEAPVATEPVRVPVTVLNATSITGLAGKISDAVVAGGWESPGAGGYPGTDVATTTVFFTEGDEQQRQAAVQLVEQFPELSGPAPRFFEVPDVPAPGLVIVATGNWQP
ncbi:LytR C-terminal domain-containing protein [Blastococcus xanthinilyticus]|uniref:LytR cell envelope-related transcriptional attenuator n=1 Tax=Blastococcus xanthinilyticus TaxID=1564164 RepID=A0A5S5CP59_9ACTN|nr:LytR C-terminal domain-containing protein [Blastococcus xanthinilyticus]TYP84831.1 LytR cell envelope-related transcriptional attenuator [Blastococcus xanthinilyticus]